MQLCLTKKYRSVILRFKHESKLQYELQKQSSKDESTQFFTLPSNFCKIIATTNKLIH